MARRPMKPAGLGRATVPPPPPRQMPVPPPRPQQPEPAPSAEVPASAPIATNPTTPAEVAVTATHEDATDAPQSRRRAHSYADDIAVPITLSLPGPLIKWVREQRTTDQTVADVVLRAIVNNLDSLSDRVFELRNHSRKEGGFTLSAPKSELVIGPLQIHTRTSNLKEIDRLVTQYGAENRSQLVRAAIEAASQK